MLMTLLVCYVPATLLARNAIGFVLFLVLYECIQLCQQGITAAQELVSVLSGSNNTGAIFVCKVQV